jgi:uncharacterized membrane protein YoaK (UPF0700 family)
VKTAERDTLLFLLAITSRSADGWSYIGLGHVFVANMTGNTVLLGIAVFEKRGDMLHPLVALTCYAIGVAVGSFLTRNVTPNSIWSKLVTRTLFLEAFLLVASAIAWISFRGMPGRSACFALLACIAAGIGLQSGALLPLRLPGIITTYITGTWTTLVSGLVLINSSQKRVNQNKNGSEDRLLLQIGFLVIYFMSAIATGWSSRYVPELIRAIGFVPVLIVAAWSALRA